jgi:hypothetical protein
MKFIVLLWLFSFLLSNFIRHKIISSKHNRSAAKKDNFCYFVTSHNNLIFKLSMIKSYLETVRILAVPSPHWHCPTLGYPSQKLLICAIVCSTIELEVLYSILTTAECYSSTSKRYRIRSRVTVYVSTFFPRIIAAIKSFLINLSAWNICYLLTVLTYLQPLQLPINEKDQWIKPIPAPKAGRLDFCYFVTSHNYLAVAN